MCVYDRAEVSLSLKLKLLLWQQSHLVAEARNTLAILFSVNKSGEANQTRLLSFIAKRIVQISSNF